MKLRHHSHYCCWCELPPIEQSTILALGLMSQYGVSKSWVWNGVGRSCEASIRYFQTIIVREIFWSTTSCHTPRYVHRYLTWSGANVWNGTYVRLPNSMKLTGIGLFSSEIAVPGCNNFGRIEGILVLHVQAFLFNTYRRGGFLASPERVWYGTVWCGVMF